MQLPDVCDHCEHSSKGVNLWYYLGFGDYLCVYCGEVWNPQFPKRYYQDNFLEAIKQELIEQVTSMRPEPGNLKVRWLDKPRKSKQERQQSSAESQRKWKAKNPDKVKKYQTDRNKLLKGEGTHNRVVGK